MRTLLMACSVAALAMGTSAADAQHYGGAPAGGGGMHAAPMGGGGGMRGPVGGGAPMHGGGGGMRGRPVGGGGIGYGGGARWGNKIGGRWYAGNNAPGGWGGYRRPHRGWTLPSYWVAPGFYIGDYGAYGLGAPPYGYEWSRYYNDAVLIDGGGRVYDSVSGIDWDAAGGYDEGPEGYPDQGGPGYPPPPAGYGQPLPPPPPAGYGSSYSYSSYGYAVAPTTTTEYVEEVEHHYRPPVRHVWHKPVWHPPVHKCGCGCCR